MTQYDVENAIFRIDGYFSLYPGRHPKARFEDAKAETIKNLKAMLDGTESITWEQFKELSESKISIAKDLKTRGE